MVGEGRVTGGVEFDVFFSFENIAIGTRHDEAGDYFGELAEAFDCGFVLFEGENVVACDEQIDVGGRAVRFSGGDCGAEFFPEGSEGAVEAFEFTIVVADDFEIGTFEVVGEHDVFFFGQDVGGPNAVHVEDDVFSRAIVFTEFFHFV